MGQWVGLDRWQGNWVVELPEVGVGAPVEFEIQTRRGMAAKNVERISGNASQGIDAKAETNRGLIRVQFIL